MDEEDDDQRLLHSLGVTSANIEDIEKKIFSQAKPSAFSLLLLARSIPLSHLTTTALSNPPTHNLLRLPSRM